MSAYECQSGGSPSAAPTSFSKLRCSVVNVAPRRRARAEGSMFCTAG
jgi:hypothetical protein